MHLCTTLVLVFLKYYSVSTETVSTLFFEDFSPFWAPLFLSARSILCWKMTRIFDFIWKLKKLWRKTYGWRKIKFHKILEKKIPVRPHVISWGPIRVRYGNFYETLWGFCASLQTCNGCLLVPYAPTLSNVANSVFHIFTFLEIELACNLFHPDFGSNMVSKKILAITKVRPNLTSSLAKKYKGL